MKNIQAKEATMKKLMTFCFLCLSVLYVFIGAGCDDDSGGTTDADIHRQKTCQVDTDCEVIEFCQLGYCVLRSEAEDDDDSSDDDDTSADDDDSVTTDGDAAEDEVETCEPGSLRCECYTNGTCDEPWVCMSGVCVSSEIMDGDWAEECQIAADCPNDGLACTVRACLEGECVQQEKECAFGCNSNTGLCYQCSADADCASDLCHADTCSNHVCVEHAACPDQCDPQTGRCFARECARNSDCVVEDAVCQSGECADGLCHVQQVENCCREADECPAGNLCQTPVCEDNQCGFAETDCGQFGCNLEDGTCYECFTDYGCLDGNLCTVDTCVAGYCDHVSSLCVQGCLPETGQCVECATPADCVEPSDPCLVATCEGNLCGTASKCPDLCASDGRCYERQCTVDAECAPEDPICQTGRCENGLCQVDEVVNCCHSAADCDADLCEVATCVGHQCGATVKECEEGLACNPETGECVNPNVCPAGTLGCMCMPDWYCLDDLICQSGLCAEAPQTDGDEDADQELPQTDGDEDTIDNDDDSSELIVRCLATCPVTDGEIVVWYGDGQEAWLDCGNTPVFEPAHQSDLCLWGTLYPTASYNMVIRGQFGRGNEVEWDCGLVQFFTEPNPEGGSRGKMDIYWTSSDLRCR